MTSATEQKKVRVLFPDDVQNYIDKHEEGTYLLLDVRQPPEYEEAHLPGAKLIPLPQLADGRVLAEHAGRLYPLHHRNP